MLLLFSNSLVLVGTIILIGSLAIVRKITRRLPLGSSRTSWNAMAALPERLRNCIESHTFLTDYNKAQKLEIRVTVSIGVASFADSGNDEESLVQVADQNLYQARHGGRNQVVATVPND